MDDAAMGKKRPSPRRLERHPVYVLSLTVPSHEVDAMYEPRKSTLGYRVSCTGCREVYVS